MKSNEIPVEVWDSLPHVEYVPYSFDVTADGNRAVIALCSEDVDFPEIWVFENDAKKMIQVDNDVLIDYPISKAFWAENQIDIVIVSKLNDSEPGLLRIDVDTGTCYSMEEIKLLSEYVTSKNSAIVDFTETKAEDLDEEKDIEVGNYESYVRMFAETFKVMMDEEMHLLSQPGEEAFRERKILRYYLGGIIYLLDEAAEKHKLEKFVSYDDIPPEVEK